MYTLNFVKYPDQFLESMDSSAIPRVGEIFILSNKLWVEVTQVIYGCDGSKVRENIVIRVKDAQPI